MNRNHILIIALVFIAACSGISLLRHRPAKTVFYTVTVGDGPNAWEMTNCIDAVLHTNDCYLIRWVEGGITNEFHAWMVKVKIEKQEGKL